MIRWAKPCKRPTMIGTPRPRDSAKKLGLRYEHQLAKALPWFQHGQWFEYLDTSGMHYCQVDLLHRRRAYTVVIEAKLTWVPEAERQVERYRRVAEAAFQLPVLGIIACKYLKPGIPNQITGSLAAAVILAQMDRVPVWHCIDPRLAQAA